VIPPRANAGRIDSRKFGMPLPVVAACKTTTTSMIPLCCVMSLRTVTSSNPTIV